MSIHTEPRPRDHADAVKDIARDLSYVASQISSLKGDANAYLTDPNYSTLRLRLENAHAAVEAAMVDAPGAEPRFSHFIASGAGSKLELVSYRDPLEEAREYYKKGLKEGDVVEAAGYPTDPNPTVRVVRDGKVIATYWSAAMEMYATYCPVLIS